MIRIKGNFSKKKKECCLYRKELQSHKDLMVCCAGSDPKLVNTPKKNLLKMRSMHLMYLLI